MRSTAQITGIQLKRMGVAALVVGGLCVQAFAQSSPASPSLPPLPALPNISASAPAAQASVNTPAPQAPTLAALPIIPQAPSAATPSIASDPSVKLPELGVDKKNAGTAQGGDAQAGSSTPPQAEAAPSTASPEAGEAALAAKVSSGEKPADTSATPNVNTPPSPIAGGLPSLPGLPGLPGLPTAGGDAASAATIPAIALPEIQVDQQAQPPAIARKPKLKTWMTKLAPSIIPPATNFNYKRDALPEAIYRTQYDSDNQHLPRRMTRDDYAGLLFTSVAANDVEATRALLNVGTGLQVVNSYGETPLATAKRIGAVDVAALLVARGAR
jgi:ankyrin repeat protein